MSKGYNPGREEEIYLGVYRSKYYTRHGDTKEIRIDEPTFKKGEDGKSRVRQILAEAKAGDVVRLGVNLAFMFNGKDWERIETRSWLQRIIEKLGIEV